MNIEDAARFDTFLAEIREAIVNGQPVSGGASLETETVRIEIKFEPIEKAPKT